MKEKSWGEMQEEDLRVVGRCGGIKYVWKLLRGSRGRGHRTESYKTGQQAN